jgi:hypothetical protein
MSIITLTEYKAYKRINSDTKDSQHQLLLDAASTYIFSYCNSVFLAPATDYVELYNGNQEYILLDSPLVTTLTSVMYSSKEDATFDKTLAEYTDFVVEKDIGKITAIDGCLTYAKTPVDTLQVTYTAGYTEYPEDVKLACVNLVDYYMEEQYTPSKSLAGASVQNLVLSNEAARPPAHIRMVLNSYVDLL